MLIVWGYFLAAAMDRLSQSKAYDAEHIHAMILSNEVSDDYSLDDGKESEENYVEPTEGDSKCAEDAMSDNYCCTEVDATDNCFQ
jgi:hypothetical protein